MVKTNLEGADKTLSCSSCKKELPVHNFYKDKHTARGYKSRCKQCTFGGVQKKQQESGVNLSDKNLDVAYHVEQAKKEPLPWFELDEHLKVKDDGNFGHKFIVLFAPRESGKTTIIGEYYPKFLEKFDRIFFFTKSVGAEVYDQFRVHKETYFIEGFDMEVLLMIRKLQKETRNAFDFLIIFDDCLKQSMRTSEEFLDYASRGRNENCTVIFSTQSDYFLQTIVRDNTDYMFILGMRTQRMSDSIYEKMVKGLIPLPEDFRYRRTKAWDYFWQLMRHHTEDHKAFVIDFQKNERYTFKAEDPHKIKKNRI